MKFNLTSEIRGALRLIFRKSPHRKAALQRARVEIARVNKDGSRSKIPGVFYNCAECEKLFKPTEIEVHHLEKVGPAPGSKNAPVNLTWEIFIRRMFCDPSLLMVACKSCHAQLTKEGK